MLTIIGLMLAGIAIGFLLRQKRLKWINQVITVLIWLLLFLLGITVGSNKQIIDGLRNLGLEALFLSVAGIIGSVLCAWALWRWTNNEKKRTS